MLSDDHESSVTLERDSTNSSSHVEGVTKNSSSHVEALKQDQETTQVGTPGIPHAGNTTSHVESDTSSGRSPHLSSRDLLTSTTLQLG